MYICSHLNPYSDRMFTTVHHAGYVTLLFTLVMLYADTQAQTTPAGSVVSLPVWKQVFVNFTSWKGYYVYNKKQYTCTLQILRVVREEGGIVYAEFTDVDTNLQFEGRSSDNVTIIMRRSHLYKAGSERITPYQDFEITGRISQSDVHKGWQFRSSVTKPDVNKANFTNFILYNGSDSVTSTGADDGSGNHLGLLIGLVILCVALGVAVMGGMLYYGFKKGLLRHVPSSYENFHNSKAEFDSKQDTVHI